MNPRRRLTEAEFTEAVRQAREYLEIHRSRWRDPATRHAYAARVFYFDQSTEDRQWFLERMVDAARAGKREAFLIVREIAAESIARNRTLPMLRNVYIAALLRSTLAPRSPKDRRFVRRYGANHILISGLLLTASNRSRDALIREVAIELFSTSQPLPCPLNDYIGALLREEVKPPSPRPEHETTWYRDLFIVRAIRRLEVAGVPPTRMRDGKHRRSGCDAVAEALKELGERCHYDRAEQIWVRRNKVTIVP